MDLIKTDEKKIMENKLVSKFTFETKDWGHCRLIRSTYPGGRTAIVVLSAGDEDHDYKDGELMTVLSVNLPEYPLAAGEIYIKTYGENEQIAKDVLGLGFFQKVGEMPSGFVNFDVWKFEIDPNEIPVS